jgi:hypothetical protein
MTILASDTFDRANATTLGSNWAVPLDYSPGIFSNGVDVTGTDFTTGAYYSGISWPADHSSQATFVALGALYTAVTARQAAAVETMYAAGSAFNDFASHELRIWKWVAGAFSDIGGSGYTIAPGNVIRLEVQGTTLRAYADNVLKITRTDSSISSGSPGIRLYHSAQDVILLNDWVGADFAVAGGGSLLRQLMQQGLYVSSGGRLG